LGLLFFLGRRPGCLSSLSLALLGIPGTKHCAKAAPILAATACTGLEVGRDQKIHLAPALVLYGDCTNLPEQRGEKAGCQFATLCCNDLMFNAVAPFAQFKRLFIKQEEGKKKKTYHQK
ncbi:hypothetical protein N324_06829, partial [Chlamydotis macqueenii]